MECRGCGKELGGSDVHMVAEWPFCQDCFERLLAKKENTAAVAAEPDREASVAAPPPEPPAPEKGLCHLCRREMERGLLKRVAIWMFCPECYADLAMRPAVVSSESEGVDAEGESEGPDARAEEEDPGIAARVRVGFAHFVNCARCGRRIPEGGSRSVDGEPFCPDCHHALALESKDPERTGGADEGRSPSVDASWPENPEEGGATAPRCQSCDQPVAPGASVELEGFRICRACAGTNPEMAVRLARSRHQKMMRKLEQDLSKG